MGKTTGNHQYSIRESFAADNRQTKAHSSLVLGTLGGHDGSSVSAADFDPNRNLSEPQALDELMSIPVLNVVIDCPISPIGAASSDCIADSKRL